jgi:hypothetical protein
MLSGETREIGVKHKELVGLGHWERLLEPDMIYYIQRYLIVDTIQSFKYDTSHRDDSVKLMISEMLMAHARRRAP